MAKKQVRKKVPWSPKKKPQTLQPYLFRPGQFWMFRERYEHCFGKEALDEMDAEIRLRQDELRTHGPPKEGQLRDIRKNVYTSNGMGDYQYECAERLTILEAQKAKLIRFLSHYDRDRINEYAEAERLRVAAVEQARIEQQFQVACAKMDYSAAEEERRKERKRIRIHRWRKAVTALPSTGAPNEKDLEWVYHLLPMLVGPKYERDDNGVIILHHKHILDAPSRGAVMMLLNALEDPKDFTKAVIDVVKSKSKKDERKPGKPDEESAIDGDPDLGSLLDLQKKMSKKKEKLGDGESGE